MPSPSPSAIDARKSGTFDIGGDRRVTRLGFGAMRITGKGIWGQPDDKEEARRVLARLPELGIDFIDTADSYGPAVSETLIRECLHPYKGLTIATKGGLTRPGPSQWVADGRPDYLRQCVEGSLDRLGLSRIDLWQLHRIDPNVPEDEQFSVIRDMQNEGLIRHIGLSQVSVAEIEAAERYFKVATVQNLYNLADRTSEETLDFCTRHGIGFIPWFPLGSGGLTKDQPVIAEIAAKYEATPGQIALAWLLKKSPVMLPIPGTGRRDHLEENTEGASLVLSDEDMDFLTEKVRARGKKKI